MFINKKMSNILYYSKRCQHSKSIIIHISQSPVKDQIQFVCVDDLIKSGNLPSFVKSVPLIFKRDTNTLLKGDAAMDWIRSFNPPETSGDINGFDSFGSAYSGLSEDGYEGAFSTDDSYSFIDGAAPNGSNLSQPSGASGQSSSMKSEKQNVMDSAYDKMMKERESVGNPIART